MGAAYQSQAVSGYNTSPPPDDGTTVAANKITWNSTIKTKLSDPLNTFIAAVNSQLVTWSDFSSVTTSTSLTTNASHHMQSIEVTSGSPTISLGDAATMTKNYIVTVTNEGTGAPVINLATAANTLDGTANGTFTFPTGTKTSFTFKVNNGATGYDTEKVGGKTILAQTSVVTPIVDSGSTGTFSLKTNNGTTQFSVFHLASAVNNWSVRGAATGGSAQFFVSGSDSNPGGAFYSQGTGTLTFGTDFLGAQPTQLQILHTASATRNITVTGSNGGNPTISTTAGSLAITPSVVIAGASLQVGTTPSSVGTINIPYGNSLASHEASAGSDINLIRALTQNSKTDIVQIGGNASGFYATASKFAGAPTASDLPDQNFTVWRDTSGATTKLYYNNGGTLQSVALT